MTLNPWLLTLALLLLWCPRQWLRFRRKGITSPRFKPSKRTGQESRAVALKFRDELAKPRNWVDFVRALAGAFLIGLSAKELPDATSGDHLQIVALRWTVLLIAMLIQTARRGGGRFTLVAPVFFILGLSFDLLGWEAALFAFITIWIFSGVLSGQGLFLFVFAALVVGFGLLLSPAPRERVILMAFLAMVPVLLSAMAKRRLVRLNKKKTRTGSE